MISPPPLIRQHFCHFSNPHPPPLPPQPATSPCNTSSLPSFRAFHFHPSPEICLPFVIIPRLILHAVFRPLSKCFSPPVGARRWCVWGRGGGRLTSSPMDPYRRCIAPSFPFSLIPPILSAQWMRDASWRKQREMGPITALGAESWLINSNSLTNCFFTKNHLSLSSHNAQGEARFERTARRRRRRERKKENS